VSLIFDLVFTEYIKVAFLLITQIFKEFDSIFSILSDRIFKPFSLLPSPRLIQSNIEHRDTEFVDPSVTP